MEEQKMDLVPKLNNFTSGKSLKTLQNEKSCTLSRSRIRSSNLKKPERSTSPQNRKQKYQVYKKDLLSQKFQNLQINAASKTEKKPLKLKLDKINKQNNPISFSTRMSQLNSNIQQKFETQNQFIRKSLDKIQKLIVNPPIKHSLVSKTNNHSPLQLLSNQQQQVHFQQQKNKYEEQIKRLKAVNTFLTSENYKLSMENSMLKQEIIDLEQRDYEEALKSTRKTGKTKSVKNQSFMEDESQDKQNKVQQQKVQRTNKKSGKSLNKQKEVKFHGLYEQEQISSSQSCEKKNFIKKTKSQKIGDSSPILEQHLQQQLYTQQQQQFELRTINKHKSLTQNNQKEDDILQQSNTSQLQQTIQNLLKKIEDLQQALKSQKTKNSIQNQIKPIPLEENQTNQSRISIRVDRYNESVQKEKQNKQDEAYQTEKFQKQNEVIEQQLEEIKKLSEIILRQTPKFEEKKVSDDIVRQTKRTNSKTSSVDQSKVLNAVDYIQKRKHNFPIIKKDSPKCLYKNINSLSAQQLNKLQVIRQTLSLKFQAFKYNFILFHNQMIAWPTKKIKTNDLEKILTEYPFFLDLENITILLCYCTQKEEKQVNVDTFCNKIKEFIKQYEQMSEQEQLVLEKKIHRRWICSEEQILKSLRKNQVNQGQITKQKFYQTLKQFKFEEKQIHHLLCQSVAISTDINHIKYQQYFSNFLSKK